MKTKFKVLLCTLALVLVVGLTAVTVWALTRTQTEASFRINFVGKRDVEATISAKSFVSSSNVPVEELALVTFTKDTTEAKGTVSTSFVEDITVESYDDVVSYVFEITNTSTEELYSDLIISPKLTVDESTNIITGMYYSEDGVSYNAMGENHLTAHKGDTIFVKVDVLMTERDEEIQFGGDINITLSSEDDKPAGYREDYQYSVVDGVAYRAPVCTTCGEVGEAVAMRNGTYIIATPATAQDILDHNMDNKIVIFDAGNYGKLFLRESIYGTTIAKHSTTINELVTEENVTSVVKPTNSYTYTRSIKNVTFTAVDGAVFTDLFIADSTWKKSMSTYYLNEGEVNMDNIRNQAMADTVGASTLFNLENITFSNMKFEGARARLMLALSNSEKANNITVSNCSFIAGSGVYDDRHTSTVNGAAAYFHTEASNILNNFKFIGNTILGHRQGVATYNVNNAVYANNDISGTYGNGMAVQYTTDKEGSVVKNVDGSSGEIVIVNNKITNCISTYEEGKGLTYAEEGDRAIRFGMCENANVVIANNYFNNTWYQVLTSGTSAIVNGETVSWFTGCNYQIFDNYYGVLKLDNVKGTDELFNILWVD